MRRAHTVLELVVSMVILTIITAAVTPAATRARDRATVRAAAATLRATLAAARDAALSRATPALVLFDASPPAITVVIDADTIIRHALTADFTSQLTASRGALRFGPTGRAFGASNTTLIVRARSAADTITVSRVGRVR